MQKKSSAVTLENILTGVIILGSILFSYGFSSFLGADFNTRILTSLLALCAIGFMLNFMAHNKGWASRRELILFDMPRKILIFYVSGFAILVLIALISKNNAIYAYLSAIGMSMFFGLVAWFLGLREWPRYEKNVWPMPKLNPSEKRERLEKVWGGFSFDAQQIKKMRERHKIVCAIYTVSRLRKEIKAGENFWCVQATPCKEGPKIEIKPYVMGSLPDGVTEESLLQGANACFGYENYGDVENYVKNLENYWERIMAGVF